MSNTKWSLAEEAPGPAQLLSASYRGSLTTHVIVFTKSTQADASTQTQLNREIRFIFFFFLCPKLQLIFNTSRFVEWNCTVFSFDLHTLEAVWNLTGCLGET